MVEPITYWVHTLIRFDPISGESKIVKTYITYGKEKKSDDEEIKLPKFIKKVGEVEL